MRGNSLRTSLISRLNISRSARRAALDLKRCPCTRLSSIRSTTAVSSDLVFWIACSICPNLVKCAWVPARRPSSSCMRRACSTISDDCASIRCCKRDFRPVAAVLLVQPIHHLGDLCKFHGYPPWLSRVSTGSVRLYYSTVMSIPGDAGSIGDVRQACHALPVPPKPSYRSGLTENRTRCYNAQVPRSNPSEAFSGCCDIRCFRVAGAQLHVPFSAPWWT